jgi:hypothetical protein
MAEVKIYSAHLIFNPAAGQNCLNKCESRTHENGQERPAANS